MARRERPLSPHLQVYRPQITSVLSITHRATGVALAGGALVLTYWITSATYGAGAFDTAQGVVGSWFGKLVVIGLLFSLYYHLANGIRHLMWDAGRGFDLPTVRSTGWTVVIFSVVATAATAAVGFKITGG
ncbi:MAG: succinate dehydrogenase, cytochrome b556 subunit [Rhodospirillaceae bacterium]